MYSFLKVGWVDWKWGKICINGGELAVTFVILTFNRCILTGSSIICDTDKEPFYFLVSTTFVILTVNHITGPTTICDTNEVPFYFLVSMTFVILTRNQYTLWFPWHLWYWLLTTVYLLVSLPFVILTRNHSTFWSPWHLWYWLVTRLYTYWSSWSLMYGSTISLRTIK